MEEIIKILLEKDIERDKILYQLRDDNFRLKRTIEDMERESVVAKEFISALKGDR